MDGPGMVVAPGCILYADNNGYRRTATALNERRIIGRNKYGTELRIFNGRCALTDLIEEILDAIMYFRQYILENNITGDNCLLSNYQQLYELAEYLLELRENKQQQ